MAENVSAKILALRRNVYESDERLTTELLTLRKDLMKSLAEINAIKNRIENGGKPREKTVKKTLRTSTRLMTRLASAFWKRRAAFLITFGIIANEHVEYIPRDYKLLAYLVAAGWLVQLVFKTTRNSLDYVITYNVAIPLILAYHTLAFALNTVTSVGAGVLGIATRAKRIAAKKFSDDNTQ